MDKDKYNNLPVSTTYDPPQGNPERYMHVNADVKDKDGQPSVTIMRKKTLTETIIPGIAAAAFLPFGLMVLAVSSLIPGMKHEGKPLSLTDRLAGWASAAMFAAGVYSQKIGKALLGGWAVAGAVFAFMAIKNERKQPYTSDHRATNDYYGKPTFTNIEDAARYRHEVMRKEEEAKKSHQERVMDARSSEPEVGLSR